MTDREKLIGLLLDIEQARILRTPLTDCVDHLIANGVVFLEEIEELKADNERLRDMWAKAVSELSRAKAERPQGEWVKHKKIRGFVYCGNCKDVYIDEEWLADGKWSFCPNCGSDMRGAVNDGVLV